MFSSSPVIILSAVLPFPSTIKDFTSRVNVFPSAYSRVTFFGSCFRATGITFVSEEGKSRNDIPTVSNNMAETPAMEKKSIFRLRDRLFFFRNSCHFSSTRIVPTSSNSSTCSRENCNFSAISRYSGNSRNNKSSSSRSFSDNSS